MKTKRGICKVVLLFNILILTGCSFFPEPVSLIMAPKQALNSKILEGNLAQIAKSFAPSNTNIATPDEPVGSNSILQADFNNDGVQELVTFYKSSMIVDKIGAVILSNQQGKWKELMSIQGKGYEISWGSASDITGDGVPELLVGWKIGVSAGSLLEIYTLNKAGFSKIAQVNFHELDLIQSEEMKEDSQFSLAVWDREIADVYKVDVLKWDKGSFTPDKELYASYFSKVASYYEQRTIDVPDAPNYWYYLADSLLKSNREEAALESLNKGFKLNLSEQDYKDFTKLKISIQNELDIVKHKDIEMYVPEADITLNIPRTLASNISIEGGEGEANEYNVNFNIIDNNKKGLLFTINIRAKEFLNNEVKTLPQVIAETDDLVYGIYRTNGNPFIKEPSSLGYKTFTETYLLLEEIISSIRLGSSYVKHISLKESIVATKIMDAHLKYAHVSKGGNLKGKVDSFQLEGMDYRYLGSDIGTSQKLNKYLSPTFSLEAIGNYRKKAKIIEHNGRLAQPNADGGTLLNYSNSYSSIIGVKDFGTERQVDIKIPIGKSLVYEIKSLVFKKTEEGWRITAGL